MASTQIPAVITYHKPGTRPPVYVAGTFSDPPWEPHEMDRTSRPDGEYDFKKEIRAEPGSKVEYKFRIGDGDWWVLQDDGPTVTDSAGNTNHVLEVPEKKTSDHAAGPEEDGQQHAGGNEPMSFAKVAAKHFQPPDQHAADRSGTGTPVTARVAAEVADSAELLHEEVPEREKPQGDSRTSKAAETGDDVASTAVHNDNQNTILVLPPEGEGKPFQLPQEDDFSGGQDGYIADKSPLFAHECVGLFESDEEPEPEVNNAREPAPVEEIDPDKVDLNDPTLERFPSNREGIIDTVRKLESGLEADQAAFDGSAHSPVVNPSRRGTVDITGDFELAPPHALSAPSHDNSKKSSFGSVESAYGSASLHSITEAEEPAAAAEDTRRPAVVFSNPLKRRPEQLKLPTSDEDEGVALPNSVSPRTVTVRRPPAMSPETSSPESPTLPRTTRRHVRSGSGSRNVAPVGPELGRDKERSMQEVRLHPPPSGGPSNEPAKPSYAQVASTQPTPAQDGNEAEDKSSAPSSAADSTERKAAPQPAHTEHDGESAGTASKPPARRLSYAEVAAKPPSAEQDKTAAKPQPAAAGSSASAGEGAETAAHGGQDQDQSQQLRKRGPARGEAPSRSSGPGSNEPPVKPKKGGGWIRAFFRLIFVDLIAGVFRKVMRFFRMGGGRGQA